MKTAMIFAAGFGKRLQPLTLSTPKPLLPVGNTSCLERSIEALLTYGIQRIVINTHHLPDAFTPLFQKYGDAIIPLYEKEILETGGGVKNALEHSDEDMLCLNGDVWFENYSFLDALIKSYDNDLSDAHLLLIHKKNILYGDYLGDYDMDVTHHLIHRERTETLPNYVYGGSQILNKTHFAEFSKNKMIFSLREFYDYAETMNSLTGIECTGLWCDIGTLDVYKKINTHQMLMV